MAIGQHRAPNTARGRVSVPGNMMRPLHVTFEASTEPNLDQTVLLPASSIYLPQTGKFAFEVLEEEHQRLERRRRAAAAIKRGLGAASVAGALLVGLSGSVATEGTAPVLQPAQILHTPDVDPPPYIIQVNPGTH